MILPDTNLLGRMTEQLALHPAILFVFQGLLTRNARRAILIRAGGGTATEMSYYAAALYIELDTALR